MKITYKPVTSSHWKDVVSLFGDRGACGGCWCMTWRFNKAQFERNKGAGNRRALKKLIDKESVPGILAFVDGTPAGWCSFGPRSDFVRLERSRVLKPIDDRPVWSVSCLFISKPFRRKGLAVGLLGAVAAYAQKKKIKIIEAYPVIPYSSKMPDVFAWTGVPSIFERAGFTEAARPSKSRPIMRLYLVRP